MSGKLRRLLPHEHEELRGYINMISRYPVMGHEEFDRRIRAFLPVQRKLEALDRLLEKYRERDDDPPARLVKQHAELVAKRNALREPLVRGNLRLAMTVLHIYAGRGLSVMDLIQEGQLGVVRALERFDPDRAFQFSTYAMHWVRSRMGHALREYNNFRVFYLPHHLHQQYGILVRFADDFQGIHGRRPNEQELLDMAKASPIKEAQCIPKKLVQRFLMEPGFGTITSLDARINADDADSISLLDLLSDGKSKPETMASAREALEEYRKELDRIMGDRPGNDTRLAYILRARFGIGEFRLGRLTLEEIGKKLNLTRERIRQLEEKAFRRKHVTREEIEVLIDAIDELERQLAANAA